MVAAGSILVAATRVSGPAVPTGPGHPLRDATHDPGRTPKRRDRLAAVNSSAKRKARNADACLSPMNADDSARRRDLLANNRTLLAYIRTALAFAGLGFAVAKFGLSPKMMRASGCLGTFIVLVGLLVTIIGFAQHRAVLRKVEPPPSGAPAPWRSLHAAAAIGCVLVCALLAVYLAANIT